MHILIRKALPEELPWVNEQYDKVQFKHSVYEREYIAIAVVDGVRAGIGRLVSINESASELGGMYVDDRFRGIGLARSIVQYLLQQTEGKTVFCLPFSHLEHFYTNCGFKSVADPTVVPEEVLQKWEWCQITYPQQTLLLQMKV